MQAVVEAAWIKKPQLKSITILISIRFILMFLLHFYQNIKKIHITAIQ